MMITITDQPINIAEIWNAAQSPDCGAVNLFTGTVRNHNHGKRVKVLQYEAYAEMAEKVIAEIVREAEGQWDIKALAIAHRVGDLQIGDVAVAIAVATPHREDAFQASRFIIDRLKERAPIWKKETTEDGQEWLSQRP